MKSLDALYPVFWSMTAIATLYLVLHRPAPRIAVQGTTGRPACELRLIMEPPLTGVPLEGRIDQGSPCGLPPGTVLTVELREAGR